MTEQAHRRKWMLQMQQPLPPATVFDRVVFLIGAAAAVWLASIIAIQGLRTPWALIWFIPIWAITAYLVLPRLHRLLSDFYVPDYFFGRTRTADGLLGDPVNLGVDGSAAQLDAAMASAGWHQADPITAASSWGIITSTLTKRSYPNAPVSSLMLFGRRHDVAFQQEVEGNPKQRHHVRFWHCPPGWLLPGGARADWLGAATYDTDVRLSLFTLQVTHRIDENTDIERDHVVDSVSAGDPAVKVRMLRDFTTGYHARNGGGDRFVTDGNLPILEVGDVQVPAHEASEVQTAPEIARIPLTVAAAAGIIVLVALFQLLDVFADPTTWAALGTAEAAAFGPILVIILSIFALVNIAQVVMVWFVVRRGRIARAALIAMITAEIIVMAINYLNGSTVLGLDWSLAFASVQCISLLCLSSESAGAWVRRRSPKHQPDTSKIAG